MIKIHLVRVTILTALFTVGMLGIFDIPMDDSTTWYSEQILSKTLGGGCFWIFHKLYESWKKTDSWIQAYEKLCNVDDR